MKYKAEKIVPDSSKQTSKGAQVEEMFDEIAPQYDLLNHTLSWGLDKGWRKKGLKALKEKNPQYILDVATGTGDLAIKAYRLLHPRKILAVDISERMMQVGIEKVEKEKLSDKIIFDWQDCTKLELSNNRFDAAMVAFGIRNFEHLDKGLQEILRVLRPGGRLMILELSTPEHFPMKQGYQIYSKLVIPTVGKLLSRSKTAYTYLPQSISAFPQNKEMQAILIQNGFVNVSYRKLSFGICTLYIADKTT